MSTALAHDGSPSLDLCGVHFVPGPVAVLWTYDGDVRFKPVSCAVIDLPRGHAIEVAERVLRRIRTGQGARRSLRRDLLRLEFPGEPLLLHFGRHHVGLMRPWTPETDGPTVTTQPIVFSIGDRSTYFSYQDIDQGRDFTRRVQASVDRKPPWQVFVTERWALDSARFVPRPSQNRYGAHGMTALEDEVQQIVEADVSVPSIDL